MKMINVTSLHISEMMSWFTDAVSLAFWAGPGFRYPFTDHTFIDDLSLDSVASFSLVNHEGELAGFGQYYRRNGKCHFARLVIAPIFRGQTCQTEPFVSKKFSHILIQQLSEHGCSKLAIEPSPEAVSLFVLNGNLPAINLYLSLGFVKQDDAESMPIDNRIYMVK